MLPFLFTTLKRRLGTEDTKWWSVSGVILSHSSCKQVLRWATVRVFVMCAECGFALSFEICMDVPGKMSSWRQHIVLQISMYFFSINGAITEVQVTFARALTQPHTMTDPGFGLVAGKSLDDSFSLWSEHTASIPPKNTWILIHLTTLQRFHCVMVHPRCLRAQRSRRRFWTLLT